MSDYLSQIKEINEAIDSAVSGNHKKFDMYLNGRGDSFYNSSNYAILKYKENGWDSLFSFLQKYDKVRFNFVWKMASGDIKYKNPLGFRRIIQNNIPYVTNFAFHATDRVWEREYFDFFQFAKLWDMMQSAFEEIINIRTGRDSSATTMQKSTRQPFGVTSTILKCSVSEVENGIHTRNASSI